MVKRPGRPLLVLPGRGRLRHDGEPVRRASSGAKGVRAATGWVVSSDAVDIERILVDVWLKGPLRDGPNTLGVLAQRHWRAAHPVAGQLYRYSLRCPESEQDCAVGTYLGRRQHRRLLRGGSAR